MRNLNELDKYRVPFYGMMGDDKNGAFKIPIKGKLYNVLASSELGWEHVSISHSSKIPSWEVMCALKDMFFHEDEVVMQLHPAKEDYVNTHKNCLHLWRPLNDSIPIPPKYMV